MGLTDRIFASSSAASSATTKSFPQGHDLASVKTYRYLRLGMLAAVAALSYSILEERYASSVHCFIGSISGYYYSPVHSVFIGVMVSIGLALVVIKGRTVIEDACLSLAGVLAPVVAFIPTSYDPQDSCGTRMALVGHYLPPPKDMRVAGNSISNDLHAYLFAGSFAVGVLLLVAGTQRLRSRRVGATTPIDGDTQATSTTKDGDTQAMWWSLVAASVFLLIAWLLVVFDYGLVIQGHAWAALGMFFFLAIAALSDGIQGKKYTKSPYPVIYDVVGTCMILSGAVFVGFQYIDRSAFNGHLVLLIEVVELTLFTAFWAVQTVERWHDTV
jgi:hypothetical protein